MGVFAPIGEFIRPRLARRWRHMLRSNPNARSLITRLPSPPSRLHRMWSEAAILHSWLKRDPVVQRPFVLHCAGGAATELALQIKASVPTARMVFNIFGLFHAEYLYKLGYERAEDAPPAIRNMARDIHDRRRSAAQEADAAICVSRAMADYVVREYGVPREKLTIIPCCVNVDQFSSGLAMRDAQRHRMGLQDRLVVTYCGSMHRWQCPEASLRIFCACRRINPSAHFLALVTEPERMRAIARSNGLQESDMTVLRVPHEQVPDYLACADIGILMREASLVNQVASPVKFGEYLASGTPVIISPNVGDFSAAAEKEDIGIVIDADNPGPETEARLSAWITTLLRNAPSTRERCQAFAQRHLSWPLHLPSIENLYTRLCETDQ